MWLPFEVYSWDSNFLGFFLIFFTGLGFPGIPLRTSLVSPFFCLLYSVAAEAGKCTHEAKEHWRSHRISIERFWVCLLDSGLVQISKAWLARDMQLEFARQQKCPNSVQKYTWHLGEGILQWNKSCLSGTGVSEEGGKCLQEWGCVALGGSVTHRRERNEE